MKVDASGRNGAGRRVKFNMRRPMTREWKGATSVLELVLNPPSLHRVHHARDPRYINKNLGGALIILDRLFGTFQAEDEVPMRCDRMRPMDAADLHASSISYSPRSGEDHFHYFAPMAQRRNVKFRH